MKSSGISVNCNVNQCLVIVPAVATVLWAASPSTASAQQALQSAVEEDRSMQLRRSQAQGSPMAHNWGPLGLTAGVGLRVTYNDNVLLEDTDTDEDFIVSPTLTLAARWGITERTSLNLGVGISYDAYLSQTRPNTVSITPASNSEIAADFNIGQSVLSVYDRFSFANEYSDRSDVRDHARDYGTFDNLVGTRILWAPEPLVLEGGYGWRKILVTDDEFDELNRASHEVFARLGHIVAEQTRWGAEATASQTTYDTHERNDYVALSVGPYFDWQLTEAIYLNLHGGWSWHVFDDNGALPPQEDLSVPYAQLSVRHQLTSVFAHSLSASRQVIVGIDAEYVETAGLRYHFEWQLTDITMLSGGPFYDFGTQPLVPVEEDFDRFGVDLRLAFRLTDQLEANLTYSFFHRNSNLTGGSSNYDMNRVSAAVHYEF